MPKFEKGNKASVGRGRPKKGESLTDVLRMVMDKRGEREKLAQKLIEMAMKGDTVAMKYVFDRIDGSPKQSLEHSGPEGGSISIVRETPKLG